MSGEKPAVMKRQLDLLAERYDLADHPSATAKMDRTNLCRKACAPNCRPEQAGTNWPGCRLMKFARGTCFPPASARCRTRIMPKAAWSFPKFHIKEVQKQEGRDLNRFDLDFDLPEHFLPEFPPAIYLTTRPDLGDVSQGKLVTIENYYELFNGMLNPKQLEGLRLLLTPVPPAAIQPHRRSPLGKAQPRRHVFRLPRERAHQRGHAPGRRHPAAAVPPSHRDAQLRGVNIERLFGSQRALKTVEDFTEFEQRAAYFDGDPVIATKKGVNILERGSQVHFMAEFEEILDFPPAPKLDVFGKLDPAKATEASCAARRFSSARASAPSATRPPYYTDNLMHNLKVERFYKPHDINGEYASADGPIKTFPLRGIKDSPPYLHDGRLLTLDDTVEFFNLVLGTKLTAEEKTDLVAFMKCL